MTVWINSPVKAKTFNAGGGAAGAWMVNAALIMTSVVQVFPHTVYTR
jgi:hypothetical protein